MDIAFNPQALEATKVTGGWVGTWKVESITDPAEELGDLGEAVADVLAEPLSDLRYTFR